MRALDRSLACSHNRIRRRSVGPQSSRVPVRRRAQPDDPRRCRCCAPINTVKAVSTGTPSKRHESSAAHSGGGPAAGGARCRRRTGESFLPAPVRFKGTTAAALLRWRNRRTDFGKIDHVRDGPSPSAAGRFGLILLESTGFHAAAPMPITRCARCAASRRRHVRRHTFIRAAGRGPETAWQRSRCFTSTEHEPAAGGGCNLFYLGPAQARCSKAPPLERVNFMRDEMANIAWGVEAIVPSRRDRG